MLNIPQPGQMVLVRNRPALVIDVKKFKSSLQETIHAVWIKYIDGYTHPENDFIIWERETRALIIQTAGLPKIENIYEPDDPEHFNIFINAFKWTSINKIDELLEKDNNKQLIFSPWQSAIQIEGYQLYPVIKALSMPRITLLLADDVGLGKTIEAGLILNELIARGRLRRVLIICPAPLQVQWRDEMAEKFYIDFQIVDRETTYKLQKEYGPDSNPWNSYPRIITSIDYLRQRDVLENFDAATKNFIHNNDASLPWDMLIVDEAHNIAPKYYLSETERIKMLKRILPYFEHRLFLSATPHNGYTFSFTGMLELLNPIKFEQKTKLDDKDIRFIREHVIRRLKSDFNNDVFQKKFASREIKRINPYLKLYPHEAELFKAVRNYRYKVLDILSAESEQKKYIVSFLLNLLTKRLLSSSYAFSKTWWNHFAGLDKYDVDDDEAKYIIERAVSECIDDQEKDFREEEAARKIGSWLAKNVDKIKNEIYEINSKISNIGWDYNSVDKNINSISSFPEDSKWDGLINWINQYLKTGNNFRKDERVIIFTEYKHTLDYLVARFKQVEIDKPFLEYMFGGFSQDEREKIKLYFNDIESNLRILIATDVASEGINMQNNCRYIIHYEIPWNPMRLEQRNGRVDRYGQYRDVKIFHFVFDEEEDLKFLEKIVHKVEQIREDLGSVSELFDKSIEIYFTGASGERNNVSKIIDSILPTETEKNELDNSDRGSEENYIHALQKLRLTEKELNINAKTLSQFLKFAFALEKGVLEEDKDELGVFRITVPPPRWKNLIDNTIRISSGKDIGKLPRLVFDASYFEKVIDGRKIYLTKPDTKLIRLGHPIMQRALGLIKRKLWESPELNSEIKFSRFTITKREMTSGIDIILILYLLIEATNQLKEIIHTEVVTLPYQIYDNKLFHIENELFIKIFNSSYLKLSNSELKEWKYKVQSLWVNIQNELTKKILSIKSELKTKFEEELNNNIDYKINEVSKIYDERIKELRSKKEPKYIEKLKKEYAELKEKLRQPFLFKEQEKEIMNKLTDIEQNLENYQYDRINELEQVINEEKEKMITKVIPSRYKLSNLEVIPLGVEFCFNSKLFGDNSK